MLLRWITLITLPFIFIACRSIQPQVPIGYETQECMAYHAMMTAPMDPLAMQQLKVKCLESKNK